MSAGPSLRKQILLGLGSALLNPKRVVLPGANAGVAWAARHAASAGDLRRLMVMVVLVWDFALVSLMGLPAVQRKAQLLRSG
ncbi:hypothetical protein ACVXG7_30135 [Enterobacter hormaechei]